MTDEQQIAALQEEIRRAGRRLWRLFVCFVTAGIVAGGCLWILVAVRAPLLMQWPFASGVVITAVLAGLASAGLVEPVARRFYAARLRERLSSLTPMQRVRTLLQLEEQAAHDPNGFLKPLLQQLRVDGTELIPATAPDARGDEASPAETVR